MIANTQANPLSSLLSAIQPAATSVMGSASGASQPRFDLTLLEMTKQVVDSTLTTDDSKVVVPEKVKKALESVLNTLAQQTPQDPIQAFSSEPAAVKVQNLVIDQAAGAGNLNLSEHKQLNDLVEMAVGKIQSSYQSVIALPNESVEEGTRAFSVLHSGPQGGTTVQPSNTVSTDNSFTASRPEPVTLEDDSELSKKLPQLAANVQAPVIISTRTQVNAETNAETTAPISGASVQPAVSASTSVQEPTAIVLTTQAPKPAQAAEQAPKLTVQTPREIPSEVTISPEITKAISNQTQAAPPIQQAPEQVQTESTEVAAAKPVAVKPSGSQPQPQQQIVVDRQGQARVITIPQIEQLFESAQVEVLPSTALPIEILPGSEVVLNSDIKPLAVQPLPAQAAHVQPVLPEVAKAVMAPEFTQAAVQIVAPAAVAETPVAVQAPNPQVPNDAMKANPVEFEASESRTITPMKRFLDDAELRSSLSRNSTGVQAPLPLTAESFKDLASSISREYSLRENVFQQAVDAIEEAGQTASQIRIHLKPESLGSLEVSLSMEGGKLTARLIASSPEVRDVFAANLAQFKQALESQGLQVNQLSVAVRADVNSQQQPQQWQQQPSWQQASNGASPAPVSSPFASFMVPTGFDAGSSTFNALA